MNVGSLLSETAAHHGGHVALRYGNRETTYAETEARVNSLAAALLDLGASRGDRVAFLAWNRPEIIEAMFATFKLGLVLVPLNPRYTAEEVAYHLNDPRVTFVFHGPGFEGVVADAVAQAPSVRHVIGFADARADVAVAHHGHEQLIALRPRVGDMAVDVEPDDVCWLFYTSGTTGRPKGAMLTHANLLFVVVGWVADLTALTPDDVTLHVAPLTHGAGFHALAAVAKGSTQVIPEPPSVTTAETVRLLVDEGVTNTWMVPTQVVRLVAELGHTPTDLSRLTSIVYGGAPFHLDDLKHAVAVLGTRLVQLFGQGETPMTATYLRHGEHRLGDPVVEARLASAGHARTGMQVRVVDESGQPAPEGVAGEIVVRGPAVMKGYWDRPEATAEALRDGWLHTGDVGALREGYLYVLDRMKDLIISGGSNVYAREVEEVLLEHPDVSEVAVIGLPDRDWGERVVAVVVPRAGASGPHGIPTPPLDASPPKPTSGDGVPAPQLTSELMARCREHLASYKRPKQYELVDELPRSPYGKVLKRQLRDRLSQSAASSLKA